LPRAFSPTTQLPASGLPRSVNGCVIVTREKNAAMR
jgi:hypothetical protein